MARSRGAKQIEMTYEGVQFGMSFATDWDSELATFVENTSFTQGETFFRGSQHENAPFMVVVEMAV